MDANMMYNVYMFQLMLSNVNTMLFRLGIWCHNGSSWHLTSSYQIKVEV
jgi:hypothetical protein